MATKLYTILIVKNENQMNCSFKLDLCFMQKLYNIKYQCLNRNDKSENSHRISSTFDTKFINYKKITIPHLTRFGT